MISKEMNGWTEKRRVRMRKYSFVLFLAVVSMVFLMACGKESTGGEEELLAKVLEINEGSAVVEALESEDIRMDSLPRYSFGTKDLDDIGAEAGDVVRIVYTGDVMETWPMQIQAVSWSVERKASELEPVETVDAPAKDETAEFEMP